MDYTVYRIENEIALLPSLLKMCLEFQMPFWYNKEPYDKNDVKIIAIRCINCVTETDLSMYNINTN